MEVNEYFWKALEFIDIVKTMTVESPPTKYIITGHSLGGKCLFLFGKRPRGGTFLSPDTRSEGLIFFPENLRGLAELAVMLWLDSSVGRASEYRFKGRRFQSRSSGNFRTSTKYSPLCGVIHTSDIFAYLFFIFDEILTYSKMLGVVRYDIKIFLLQMEFILKVKKMIP